MVRLYEFEAKEIVKKYGILVPKGYVVNSIDDLRQNLGRISPPLMVKAQILAGGRGKLGGIKVAKSYDDALKIAKEIFGSKLKDYVVKRLLIEKKLKIKNEFFIGIIIDVIKQKPTFVFSPYGGIDIEELAKTDPNKIIKLDITFEDVKKFDFKSIFKSLQYSDEVKLEIEKTFQILWQIMNDYDLDLIEINPCILSIDEKLYAADVRMNIDDNSIFRHQDFIVRQKEGFTEAENSVHKMGMSYIEMEGDIGIICNGAGLVMATIDTVKFYGGSSANFLDIGGGATKDRILFALNIISANPKIKGILINIVGGITRCDEIALGIVEFLEKRQDITMVIRLVGTREEEGKKILIDNKITVVDTMEEAIKKIIKLIASKS